jgi:hypothetical protein
VVGGGWATGAIGVADFYFAISPPLRWRNNFLASRAGLPSCFQGVVSLFSPCYLLLMKLSKCLIHLLICSCPLNRLPVFFWKISLFPGKNRDDDAAQMSRVSCLGFSCLFWVFGGRSPRTGFLGIVAKYKARHLIENFFCKLKQYRAIATRYDKAARNFLAGIHLAAAVVLLN